MNAFSAFSSRLAFSMFARLRGCFTAVSTWARYSSQSGAPGSPECIHSYGVLSPLSWLFFARVSTLLALLSSLVLE